MEYLLRLSQKLIPRRLYTFLQPAYHYLMAFLSALIYRFPSRKITVIAVTGTKGKSSTTEILSAYHEEAGFKTALSNTVRFKIDRESENNLYKMSMPGRFFMQRFLRGAVKAGCQYAIIEMTSEGARFYRHKFIALDGLIFTNLSPEHIESHGSFQNYKQAKLSIGRAHAHSRKTRRILVVNGDDPASKEFLALSIAEKYEFHLTDAEPYQLGKEKSSFLWQGEKMETHLSGLFNIQNILAAATFAKTLGVTKEQVKGALLHFKGIRGRVEKVEAGQPFEVIVDYAHTTDSLTKLYETFQESRRICVLGGTGGGRDRSKRKEMGAVAGKFCDEIILTNEDPYDENPQAIIENIVEGISHNHYKIVIDRREAIREALELARTGDTVLITGKGTDPYIMGPRGSKIPWDDATVAREELKKLFTTH